VDIDRALEMELDPDLFIDVMGNLVDNAVKYTPSGFVRVEVVEEPGAVVFKVRDSGPGIAPDRQAGLFGAVQPGERSGAGIGLHVAYRAVTAMGGSIGIESTSGRGTMVWFRLPWRVSGATGAEPGAH
jgi:signal transduction histidine kinase